MGFTCVLIKEEAEGAGPQSHHQKFAMFAKQSMCDLVHLLPIPEVRIFSDIPRVPNSGKLVTTTNLDINRGFSFSLHFS